MKTEEFYHDPAFTRFYDACNPWREDFDFCVKAAQGAGRILDIGCGTGELAAKLGETAYVIGLDPAEAMLTHARTRPGGDKVRWICADAKTMDLGERFDLITMTGHAFQCVISDADQAALLAAMKRHLAPEGRVLFDSRNPPFKAYEQWTEDNVTELADPELGPIRWYFSHVRQGEVVTYTTVFEFPDRDEVLETACDLRFRPRTSLDAAMLDAGLSPSPCFGDWRGNPWTEQSPEIVYHGGHRGGRA